MTSHFQPSTLQQYQRLLSRDIQSGWLDTKTRMLEPWVRYWWVFENRVMRWALSPAEIGTTANCIRFEDILLFKTDTKNKNHMMQIITANKKYFLRAEDVEDVINWVWSIQLALTLDLVSVTNRRLSAASLATPAERPTRREGVGTGDRVHMASSVHTGAAAFLESRHPIVENGDYYSQLSQIRGYFHDENSEEYSPVRSKSRDDTKGARKQSSFGEPLSRVPSVSIFRSLPHFTATDLPEDHLSGQEKPPLPRGGASIGAFQSGMPFSSLRASPESRPMPSAAIPVGGASVEGMTSPSSSLGRSSAIPIAGGQSMAVPTKIAGSFREDDLKNSPMAMQFSSDARSPVNPIGWSPAKAADMSPPMSPFRSRGNSDEGMFMMDDDAGGAPGGRKRFESRSSVSPEFGRVHWSSGSCNEQGRYKYQEDRVVHYSNVLDEYTRRESDGSVGVFEPLPLCPGSLQSSTFSNSTLGFFGVFDGHAGHEGSTYVSQNLHLNIIKHALFYTDLPEAIRICCLEIDAAFLERCRSEPFLYCGTTAIGAFILNRTLTVFNIGDCRAVLCKGGVPVELSQPHNPNRPEEAARVERANGWIDVERVINLLQKRIDMTDPEIQSVVGIRLDEDRSYEVSRVVGDLSVSRSIGDPDYKGFTPGVKVDLCLPWPKDHTETFYQDLIIADPDIVSVEIDSNDEFLVMATDGVWDVMTPFQAVHKVRSELSMGKTSEEAAVALCNLAYRLGSSDNITAVVVTFFTID